MKSFKEYLLEEESSNHLDFISQKVSTIGYQKGKPNIPLVTTTRYSNKEAGLHSAMHIDARTGIAYWGYQVSNKEGNYTDVPPEGVSQELRTARSRIAMDHLVDFAKRNPKTPITYMTNDGKQGTANHAFFQERWPKLQEKHGLSNTLTRVEKNPLRK